MLQKFFKSLLFIFLLLLSLNGFAGEESKSLLRRIYSDKMIVHPEHDSAVELELDLTNNFASIITTRNNKISGLFEDRKLPHFFCSWFKKKDFASSKERTCLEIGDLDWDALSAEEKVLTLKHRYKRVFPLDEISWAKNRKIPELKVKDSLPMHFKKNTTHSAAEMEIVLNEQFVTTATTSNNKLSGLFPKEKTPDTFCKWFIKRDWAPKEEMTCKQIGDLAWDSLDWKYKMQVIRERYSDQGSLDDIHWYPNPSIQGAETVLPGLFQSIQTLFGVQYEPHRKHQDVDVSKVVGNRSVEYASPSDVLKLSTIEIHLRTKIPSGDLANDAWKFLGKIGLDKNAFHIHIVSNLDTDKIRSNKSQKELEGFALSMGDFYRRLNLSLELYDILRSVNVSGKNSTRILGLYKMTLFSHLNQERLAGVVDYINNVYVKNVDKKIWDDFKHAYIGFRGSDKYDQPGLWGLEVRSFTDTDRPNFVRIFLNTLQYNMENKIFGINAETMSAWAQDFRLKSKDNKKEIKDMVAAQWYDSSLSHLLKHAPAEVKAAYKEMSSKHRTEFAKTIDEKRQLRMLLHNWSNDPIFYGDKEAQELVISEQVIALKDFDQDFSPESITLNFVIQSHLAEKMLKSIGLNFKDAE